jgi:hypothetical protein
LHNGDDNLTLLLPPLSLLGQYSKYPHSANSPITLKYVVFPRIFASRISSSRRI